MPRQFKVPPGTDYPASAADYRLAKQGKPHRRVPRTEEAAVVVVPYSELAASFAANGFEEVTTENGIHEREGHK